jgi:hypothetical protein
VGDPRVQVLLVGATGVPRVRLGEVGAGGWISSWMSSWLGTGGCGARVPCLIWVLEHLGVPGDVMIDGVCPAVGGAAARSFRDLRSGTGVTGSIGSRPRHIR